MNVRRTIAILLLGTALCALLVGAVQLLARLSASSSVVAAYWVLGAVGVLVASAFGLGPRQGGSALKKVEFGARRVKTAFSMVVGLGCLCTAIDGVVSGSVATLVWREAPAGYTTRPIAWLAYMAFWLALGGYLVQDAWHEHKRGLRWQDRGNP